MSKLRIFKKLVQKAAQELSEDAPKAAGKVASDLEQDVTPEVLAELVAKGAARSDGQIVNDKLAKEILDKNALKDMQPGPYRKAQPMKRTQMSEGFQIEKPVERYVTDKRGNLIRKN